MPNPCVSQTLTFLEKPSHRAAALVIENKQACNQGKHKIWESNFCEALLRNWVCCLWGLLLRWYFFLFWIFSLVRRLEWKVYWKHLARPNPHFPYEIYLPMKHHVSKDRWDLPGYCEALQWSQEQEVQTRKQDYSHSLKILIELEISDCDGNLDDHSLPNSHFHLSFTFSFRW